MGLPANRISRFFYQVFTNLAASLTTMFVCLYSATLRTEVVDEENLLLLMLGRKSFVVTTWHTFVEAAVLCLHSRDLVIYTDHPRTEGYEKSRHHLVREVGIKTVNALGFDVLDASLEKQSVALLKFIKKIRRGSPALIAPDGPDGPIYKAKTGAVYIARKTKSAILPVGFSFSRFITLRNWDDFVLPLPFSKVVMVVGDPMVIEGRLSAGELERSTERLEELLDALCHRAGEILAEEGVA